MDKITLDKAGTRICIDETDKYFVNFPDTPYLVVTAGVLASSAPAKFDHPNILSRQSRLFEFKHYRQGGSKFWTSKAGVEFTFALPKSAITLIPEKLYSYVKIEIGGESFTLNVSGGSNGGEWNDSVRNGSHLCVVKSLRQLKAIAGVAYDPTAATLCGVKLEAKAEEEDGRIKARLMDSLAKKQLAMKLKPGANIILASGSSYMDRQDGLTIDYRENGVMGNPRQRYLCKWGNDTMLVRVAWKNIDWTKTAEANCITIENQEDFCRVPLVQEAVAV
jgi:hypothetical protein